MLLFLFVFSKLCFASPEDFFADLESFRSSSLVLKTQEERVLSTSLRALSKSLYWSPDLSVGASKQRGELNGQKNLDAEALRASLAWNLFRGGGDYFGAKAALAEKDADSLQLVWDKLSLEEKAGKLLFQSLYYRDRGIAQKELMQLKEESLRIGRERYKQGKIPLQEVMKMEVDLSLQKNRFRLSQLDIEKNQTALRSLFVDSFRTSSWPFAPSLQPKLEMGNENFSIQTQILEKKASAAAYVWKQSGALHFPTLDFSLVYQESPFKQRSNKQWTGSLDLSFPLWSRFTVSVGAAESKTRFVEASNFVSSQKRVETLEKEYLRKKIDTHRLNLLESKGNLEKSERLYADMLKGFQLGRISTNDLFQEQDRKIESLISLSQGFLAFHESVLEACAFWGKTARECLAP